MPEPKLKGKRWQKEFEKPITEEWRQKKLSAFDKKNKNPIFSIDTPPPYVNTPIHIGQATTYVLMDMFARFRRMTGWNVLFPLGLDRNGLPIEVAAEKKFKVRLADHPREKAVELCKSILKESSDASKEAFLRSGVSFNSWKQGDQPGDVYHTDSSEYRALTQDTFIDLWKKGLIYEDSRLNNYCPGCQTTLADAEIERKETETFLNFVKFTVKETGEKVIIATTRPELLCTSALVIFNPQDKRYQKLKGKTAIIPLFDREVKILPDTEADPEYGTGLMFMSASAGDQDAVRFLRKRGIKPLQAIGTDGRMQQIAGPLNGLKTKEARARVITLLKEDGLLKKQEKIMHSVPICERSKDEIEFVTMPEFYLKQVEFKPKMKEFAKKINFFSPRSRQILIDWIESVSMDWPISRRRYYATEIPLWYCTACDEPIVPPKGKYYRPWREKPPVKDCPKCKGKEFRGEERVFDTWFDSSISPLYILKYSREEAFFKKAFPCTLRPSGKEIIRNWGYYTILRCYQLTGKCVFRDHWVNFHIVDEKGKKMSKSKGNVINPQEVLDNHGAEPFRLWAASEGNLTNKDFRCSFDRIEGAAKTLTKLWNIARFISLFPKHIKPKILSPLDKWILHELAVLVVSTKKQYEDYDFHNPVVRIKNFLWETFASHYIELSKARAYAGDASALYTLHHCLEILLKLLAPVTPFITHRIYQDLHGKEIHRETFPEAEKIPRSPFTSSQLLELNSLVWKAKKDRGLSLKTDVKRLTVPQELKPVEDDLRKTHHILHLSYGKTKIEL